MPKVSVIIPVYNAEQYLSQALDSVINQTLKDIEVICVDDGSTDKSLTVLQEYAQKDDRFVILTQKNKFAGAARNKGLDIANGEYVYFMDSDDYLSDENVLKSLYEIAKDYKDENIIKFCAKVFDNNTSFSILLRACLRASRRASFGSEEVTFFIVAFFAMSYIVFSDAKLTKKAGNNAARLC